MLNILVLVCSGVFWCVLVQFDPESYDLEEINHTFAAALIEAASFNILVDCAIHLIFLYGRNSMNIER